MKTMTPWALCASQPRVTAVLRGRPSDTNGAIGRAKILDEAMVDALTEALRVIQGAGTETRKAAL
jgi:hypothetical protein